MVGKCLEWCSFHGTPKRCQIGATPKLSLQKTEAWKLKNRCGAGACGGGRTRARTWDPMIKSHLLYQLSYAPGTSPEILGSGRRRLAKRTGDVQQRSGAFP